MVQTDFFHVLDTSASNSSGPLHFMVPIRAPISFVSKRSSIRHRATRSRTKRMRYLTVQVGPDRIEALLL